ncbi:hypothetical protein [Alteribacillus sp. HJP-4]|uniref:hypothetical protein n=1 Tax=Alteribacillus sp. HJP-4 TaxID=2775394 RepID=UPI0035CD195C
MLIPDKNTVHRRMVEFEKEAVNYRCFRKEKKRKKTTAKKGKDTLDNKVKKPA